MEWLSLFASFCTYFFGQFLDPELQLSTRPELDRDRKFGISMLVLLVNVGFMFTIGWYLLQSLYEDKMVKHFLTLTHFKYIYWN